LSALDGTKTTNFQNFDVSLLCTQKLKPQELYLYICILCCMMEVVIRDGLQNGSWVTNHQETKPFSKKRRVSSEKKLFFDQKQEQESRSRRRTTSGRTPVTWSAVNRYPQSADVTRVVFSREHRLRGRWGQKSRCIYIFMCIFESF